MTPVGTFPVPGCLLEAPTVAGTPDSDPVDAMHKCNCIHTALATRADGCDGDDAEHAESGQWDAEAGFRVYPMK